MDKVKKINLKDWLRFTAISIFIGIIGGYVLLWIWSLFSLFILGYGDSGPSWINQANNVAIISGFLFTVVICQIVFLKKMKNTK